MAILRNFDCCVNEGLKTLMRSSAILTSLILLFSLAIASAQTTSGGLRGKVTDPSGAVIPNASVSATDASGRSVTVTSNPQGTYDFKGLAPSTYEITVSADGFTTLQKSGVVVTAGKTQLLDLPLEIQVEEQHVQVQSDAPTVDVSAANNASAIVIKGKDLEALSDDPDELQSELQALAGPSAGPNGGQIYVDGFTSGQLPPKSAIREIRINQNPFSAEFDKLGYGRIEIFTKPGTDKVHGQFMAMGNTSGFNSLNPFVTNGEEPGYYSEMFNGSLSGPLGKKASFFFSGQQRDIDNLSVIVATILDSNYNPVPYNTTLSNPLRRLNLSPRVDIQLTPTNTLTVRYQYWKNDETNEGVGQFSLPSQAYNSNETEQTVQISDTQVISANVVNETRFQYIRDSSTNSPFSTDPSLTVLGAFSGGGSSQGTLVDNQDRYELQNYTSIVKGKHFLRFGGRLRATVDSNSTNSNFNGGFTFSSLNAYQITEQGLAAGLSPAKIRAMGGGASQFSLVAGQPLADVRYLDVGLYVEDEWRIKPNLSFSYGLRYETQNEIQDHADFGPRFSLAWGLGHGNGPAKTVLRTGFGIFYDRFSADDFLPVERFNGSTQTQYIVANPDFYPTVPTPAQLAGLSTTSPTVYQIASNLRAPYTMEAAISLERQLTKASTISVTYLNSRGNHQFFLRNANAPYPGTYNPDDPNSGIRPDGNNTNIYQYSSEGLFNENQVITNARVNIGKRTSLFGFYTLSFANSDLGAPSSMGGGGEGFFGGGGGAVEFVSNSYDPMQDYGRAAFDVRSRAFIGGTVGVPWGLQLSPFIVISSAQPFNIIVGQDLNGDSIFNDRPALSSTAGPGGVVKVTPYGTFNTVPIAGQEIVPINYGLGSSLFSLNLRLSKTIGLGPKVEGHGGGDGMHGGGHRGGGLGGRGLTGGGGGGGPFSMESSNRKYSLTFSVAARNLLNNVNLAPPVGNLDSPQFGTSNSLAGPPYSSGSANRRIDLMMMFSF